MILQVGLPGCVMWHEIGMVLRVMPQAQCTQLSKQLSMARRCSMTWGVVCPQSNMIHGGCHVCLSYKDLWTVSFDFSCETNVASPVNACRLCLECSYFFLVKKTIGGSFLNFWGEEPSKKTTFSWCFQQNSKPNERIRIVCHGFAMFSCGPWKVKIWKFPEFMEIPFKETDQL